MPEEPKKPVPEKRAPPKVAKIEEPPPTKGKRKPPAQQLETCLVFLVLSLLSLGHPFCMEVIGVCWPQGYIIALSMVDYYLL